LSTLTLTREPVVWIDRLRAYTLLLDGIPSGTVKQGETIRVELPSRPVRVQMQIDWATSRELQIDGRHDVVLHCRGAANPFLAILWITLWRDRYIDLWQDPAQ
jgi:hypothetical protein